MSLQTFEVRVNVKNGKGHYSSLLGMHVQDEIVKMFHKEARTPKQAMQKCEKYGRPISVRKIVMDKIIGFAENTVLEQLENPYEHAIAMDEFVWQKRNKRIKNQDKDKKSIDKQEDM